MYDLTIIGGGPAGCRLAMLLAKDSKVAVVEEHEEVGVPLQCAGLVSPRTIDDTTRESVLQEIKDFKLHSPGGSVLELHSKDARGVVIDRRRFDLSLAEKASDQGAEMIYGSKVIDLNVLGNSVATLFKSEQRRREIVSSLLVGADGPRSIARRKVTLKQFDILYKGAQLEGKDRSSADGTVDMWIGNKVAPGFFAWKIPTGDSVRIGLCTDAEESPMSLLKKFAIRHFPDFKMEDRQSGLIPVGATGRLSKGRVALLGDAGGQTKPITGGGVYLGKRAAEMLAESILKYGAAPEAFAQYEQKYEEEFGSQLSRAWLIRKMINRLSDKKMDNAVRIFSEKPVVRVLERSGDIDNPASMASEILLKAPRLIQFAPLIIKSRGSRTNEE